MIGLIVMLGGTTGDTKQEVQSRLIRMTLTLLETSLKDSSMYNMLINGAHWPR
jgi:hypothetical protein